LATLVLSGVSLIVAVVALLIAVIALRRSDRNASAGMVVALNQGFADAWRHFQDADGQRRDFEFAELLNTFEIAAAIHQEGSLHGVAKELVEDYLCSALEIINADSDSQHRVSELRDTAKTFRWLIAFRNEMNRKGRMQGMSVLTTMEPRWSA
jgi:hypothetical protein